MTIHLHPDAAQRFNERAAALRARLRPIDRADLLSKAGLFASESVPAATLTEKDISKISFVGEYNQVTGERTRILFDDGHRAYELDRAGCDELASLLAAILKAPEISRRVSRARLDQEVREWLDPEHNDQRSLSERLVAEIDPAIERRSAWVPIAFLRVQSELPFGEVVFRPITAAVMDAWEAACVEKNPADAETLATYFRKLRQKFQGLAAATLDTEAEPERAIEIAAEAAVYATALLRTFCVENLDPRACSYCVPHGRLAAVGNHVWLASGPSTFTRHEWGLPPPPNTWAIADAHRPELDRIGLSALASFADSNNASEFERKLIEALLIYNRANVSRDPVDKLIYVLVALESILLRNQSEPIQAAVGDRLAFVAGKDADERMRVAALVRECYGIRSRYVHHGQSREELEPIKNLFIYAWYFFTRLIRSHRQFASKDALLESLERRKFE